ncbi:MAG: LpxI family protein [Halanaerobiales bacterium]
MGNIMERIGLLAGEGDLPFIWARTARKNGREVFAYKLVNNVNPLLEESADQVRSINIGMLDDLISSLKADGIEELVMIGGIDKTMLFQGIALDVRFKALLAGLKDLNNDSILSAIVNEFEREGIRVLPQSLYLEDLLAGHGILNSLQPDEQLLSDLKYAFKMAREIGRLDIGQTVVVQNRTVLAVETIEGTDEAIKRGGKLSGPGVVVAKVAKPGQDFRFDLPVIGEGTLNTLIAVKARGLVIEADSTFIIDKESFLKRAEENGIAVAALNEPDLYE